MRKLAWTTLGWVATTWVFIILICWRVAGLDHIWLGGDNAVIYNLRPLVCEYISLYCIYGGTCKSELQAGSWCGPHWAGR